MDFRSVTHVLEWRHRCPRFMNRETEAQRSEVTQSSTADHLEPKLRSTSVKSSQAWTSAPSVLPLMQPQITSLEEGAQRTPKILCFQAFSDLS